MWLAIALHTTPEVPLHLGPEIAVVTLGVETDELRLVRPAEAILDGPLPWQEAMKDLLSAQW